MLCFESFINVLIGLESCMITALYWLKGVTATDSWHPLTIKATFGGCRLQIEGGTGWASGCSCSRTQRLSQWLSCVAASSFSLLGRDGAAGPGCAASLRWKCCTAVVQRVQPVEAALLFLWLPLSQVQPEALMISRSAERYRKLNGVTVICAFCSETVPIETHLHFDCKA